MKPSIDKLRWVLAGGSLFLLLLLVAVVSYGRYKAASLWKNRLDKLGVHVEQTTDDITYSQTIGGRTVGILRAAKAVQRKDGKTILHSVQLTLYDKKDGSEDRIYGSEFEYDDKSGVARALGEVEMDLRVPGPSAKDAGVAAERQTAASATSGGGRDIHVRTSGLTYLRKLGVAATDQPILFSYAGLECRAKGAEFNSSDSVIHLLSDVSLVGSIHNQKIDLHAAKADLDHASDAVSLNMPRLQSGVQTAIANTAVLHLRHDGSIETAEADGSVTLQKATRQITASHLHGRFDRNDVPEEANLTGGVVLVDANSVNSTHGTASRVDAVFDGAGAPTKLTASGNSQIIVSTRNSSGQTLSRSLRGEQIVAALKVAKGGSKGEVTDLHVIGGAHVASEGAAPGGIRTTQVSADDLRALFGPNSTTSAPFVRQVVGTGHTRLQQDSPGGAQQISSGNTLQMNLAHNPTRQSEFEVVSATQDGDVRFQSRSALKPGSVKTPEPLSGGADHSVFEGASETLTLSGKAHFTQGSTTLAANTLTVNQRTGDSDASGNVMVTLSRTEGRDSTGATHIRSDRAHLVRDTQIASFQSNGALPARLWQGGSQVEAANITINGKKQVLSARPDTANGNIRAVFASIPSPKKGAEALSREAQVERVTANSLDYDDTVRVATFTGNVHAFGTTGQVMAQHAQMFFTAGGRSTSTPTVAGSAALPSAPSIGGALEKAVVWGDVRLSQPGKTGRGEKLVFTAVNSTFVLTGTPSRLPQIVDTERGSLTGASLTFQSGDNKVIVSGATDSTTADEHTRVHTETGAKQ